MSHFEQDIYQKAYALAQFYHAGQKYGDKDYMWHLEDVVNSLKQKWGEHNKELLAVGILHDILEDTDCTYEILVERTNKDVARYVFALTKPKGDLDDTQYLHYLLGCKEHHYTKEAKIHDTLRNLTVSIMADSRRRVKKYSRQLFLLVTDWDIEEALVLMKGF